MSGDGGIVGVVVGLFEAVLLNVVCVLLSSWSQSRSCRLSSNGYVHVKGSLTLPILKSLQLHKPSTLLFFLSFSSVLQLTQLHTHQSPRPQSLNFKSTLPFN